MMYYVRTKDGRRWKVREAVSLEAACNEIAHATVRGSIGGKTIITEYDRDDWDELTRGPDRVIADVVQVNSDNTERQAYQAAY